MFPHWYRYRTHCHICGTSQSGKSKFCESCLRAHIRHRTGFTVIDWHGKLYDEVLEYLAYLRPDRPIYLLNPSDPTHILPFDPFALPDGWDVSSHVARITELIVKPWGSENTNLLPTYERIIKMVLHFAAVSGEPLHHGAKLLEFPKKELREYAISLIEDDYIKQQWKQMQYVKTFSAWLKEVLSTQNRLGRFIGSKSIKLFTGLGSQFSIEKAIEEKAIVLINLKPSKDLPPESGKVFAALLLSGYLQAALDRTTKPIPHFMYLDEAQNYITADAAQMLDQVLKSGLRLTIAHHHLGQDVFREHPAIADSLDMNAKIKAIFAGLPVPEAKRFAEEFFLDKLNERWKKADRVHYVSNFYEDSYSTSSHTETLFGDQSGASDSTSTAPRLVPFSERVIDGQEDWGREEKLSKLAALFQTLKTGECFLRLGGQTYRYEVPYVRRYLPAPEKLLEYKQTLLTNHIPIHEAETRLKEAEGAFLERSRNYSGRTARPKKNPPRLHPQS